MRTNEETSRLMSKIKSKGSEIERTFEKFLRKNKILFRRHYRIAGTPDFVLLDGKIAIFCDSHFWHGYDWRRRKKEFKSNKRFWFKKITYNMRHDRKVNATLRKQGWKVLRFWEHEISKIPEKCILKIRKLTNIEN